MKKQQPILLLTLLLATPTLAETWQGHGTATFSVKATGHTVHGTVPLDPFPVTLTKKQNDTLLTFNPQITTLKITTDKKKRDQELHRHLHAQKHPTISSTATNLSLNTLTAPSDQPITLPFTLNMIGIPVKKTATITTLQKTNNKITFTATFQISQTEHGLKHIKKMGFLKVKDTIHVNVTFEMAPTLQETTIP